jgi:Membrane bound beta barrel domain (DUF5777)
MKGLFRGLRSAITLATLGISVGAHPARAQLGEEGVATTLGTRFLQTNSPLVNEKGVFDSLITHRFNEPVYTAGFQRLLGLDSGNTYGLGIEYSFLPGVAFQLYRANVDADYEFALKANLVRPKASLPLGLGVRAGLNWLTADYAEKQSSFFGQVLVSYTIADRVTIAAAPSYTERTPFQVHQFNVPINIQVKITHSIAAIGEYVPKKNFVPGSVAQWSFGVEKALYHHRFMLWIGNSRATTVDQYLGGDFVGGVTDSNIRLGFNMTRAWDIASK